MGKSGLTGNFIARLLKLILDRQYRRPVGMGHLGLCDSLLDQQNLCKTANLNHPVIEKKQYGHKYTKRKKRYTKMFPADISE